jgi:ABC-type nickel/cobalt efflux system permease component RcnA
MSLYNWTIDLPSESMNMLNDLVRMGVIQVVVQFLFFVVNPAENPFFSTMFLQTIGFVLVGVLVYWLLVRNVFTFRSSHTTEHLSVHHNTQTSSDNPSAAPDSSHSSNHHTAVATTTTTTTPSAVQEATTQPDAPPVTTD